MWVYIIHGYVLNIWCFLMISTGPKWDANSNLTRLSGQQGFRPNPGVYRFLGAEHLIFGHWESNMIPHLGHNMTYCNILYIFQHNAMRWQQLITMPRLLSHYWTFLLYFA